MNSTKIFDAKAASIFVTNGSVTEIKTAKIEKMRTAPDVKE